MNRESKTLTELEEMVLQRIREQPNGDQAEEVSVAPATRRGGKPRVAITWDGSPENAPEIQTAATHYADELYRQFEVL